MSVGRYVSGDAEAGIGGKVMSGNMGPDPAATAVDSGDGIINVKKSPEHDLNFNIEQQGSGDFIITDLDASQELMDQIDQGNPKKKHHYPQFSVFLGVKACSRQTFLRI